MEAVYKAMLISGYEFEFRPSISPLEILSALGTQIYEFTEILAPHFVDET